VNGSGGRLAWMPIAGGGNLYLSDPRALARAHRAQSTTSCCLVPFAAFHACSQLAPLFQPRRQSRVHAPPHNQERVALLRAYLESGKTQPQFCEERGDLSPRTLRSWLQAFTQPDDSLEHARDVVAHAVAELQAIFQG
jgi:hypothetical protein